MDRPCKQSHLTLASSMVCSGSLSGSLSSVRSFKYSCYWEYGKNIERIGCLFFIVQTIKQYRWEVLAIPIPKAAQKNKNAAAIIQKQIQLQEHLQIITKGKNIPALIKTLCSLRQICT